MLRLGRVLCILPLSSCAASQPTTPVYNPAVDPMHLEAKEIIDAQMNCFKREAQSKTVANVDLDTAALAVQARCIAETQRYKAFSASHTIENVPTFEARMRRQEADDLQTIKQMLALVRTSSPPSARK